MKPTIDQLTEHFLEGGFFLEEAVEMLERSLITQALGRTGGNRTAASKALGIHRNTLQRKIEQYGLGGAAAAPVARRQPGRANGNPAGKKRAS